MTNFGLHQIEPGDGLDKAALEKCLSALPIIQQDLVVRQAHRVTAGLPKAGRIMGLEIVAAIGRLLNAAD